MQYLIGPELFWMLMYAGALLLAKANMPANKAVDDFIGKCWFWIPAASLLVFILWFIPVVEKDYLLLRVWISGLIGGHLVIERTLRASSYQGPGVGMGWIGGLIFLFVFLVLGTIFIPHTVKLST